MRLLKNINRFERRLLIGCAICILLIYFFYFGSPPKKELPPPAPRLVQQEENKNSLIDQPPIFATSSESLTLINNKATLQIQLQTEALVSGFEIESSRTPDFSASRVYLSSSARISRDFSFPARYFYRFRSINGDQERSLWSKTLVVKIVEPTVFHQEATLRDPASVETLKELEIENSVLSDQYRQSRLSIETFLLNQYSTQQYFQDLTAPKSLGVGLSGLKWFEKSGIEASIKTQGLGLNSSSHQTSFKDLEARYHYRYFTNFGFAREMQISIFGGYEIVRNNGAYFANAYDLLKIGTTVEFPLGDNFAMGGTLGYGRSLRGSYKQEISWHLDYFLNMRWSVGVGYRLFLFQAGSTNESAGNQIPSRESSTEAYSVLNYHF